MSPEVESDIKQLRAELQQLRQDFGNLTHTLGETARHGKTEATEHARETVESLRDDATKVAQRMTREIETHPISGALAAFGVGVALGLMLNSRR